MTRALSTVTRAYRSSTDSRRPISRSRSFRIEGTRRISSPLLSLSDPTTEERERRAEKRADKMRLEASSLGAFHLLADCRDRAQVHAFRGQLAFGDQPLDRFGVHNASNFPEELCPYLWGGRHSG